MPRAQDAKERVLLGVHTSLSCSTLEAQLRYLSYRIRDRKKGVITKGVFSLEESLESLKSLNSLESLENGRILLYFPESGNSRKSLENGLFRTDPFSKKPFPEPDLVTSHETWSDNIATSILLVFSIVRYVAEWGIAQICLCQQNTMGGGCCTVSGRVRSSLRRYLDIEVIVSPYRAMWATKCSTLRWMRLMRSSMLNWRACVLQKTTVRR